VTSAKARTVSSKQGVVYHSSTVAPLGPSCQRSCKVWTAVPWQSPVLQCLDVGAHGVHKLGGFRTMLGTPTPVGLLAPTSKPHLQLSRAQPGAGCGTWEPLDWPCNYLFICHLPS
jgi:hypothetical protein